jgi:large repetitive protein
MFRHPSAVLLCAALLFIGCASSTSPAGPYSVGGTVSGLVGTGLALQDNGGDTLLVTRNGAFTFATHLTFGTPYAVTISAQPSSPDQRCTAAFSGGTVDSLSVSNIAIKCVTSSYSVGGTVSGLKGQGLILQDNGGGDLAVSANGGFTFAQPVLSGATFAVTVKTQPSAPTQACTVTAGAGTVSNAKTTSVVVTCSPQSFNVGGTVVGLLGSGLALQDNGGASLAITGNGAFSFPVPVTSGQNYSVTLKSQPVSPSQSCTVSGGAGIVGGGNVSAITVNCSSNRYTIGGTVTGLVGTGAMLQSNGADSLRLTSNGSFAFATPLSSGAAFQVTVSSQPGQPWQTCALTGGSGNVGGSNVTSVVVTCTTNSYAVGGTINGLAGAGLVLQDNQGDTLAVTPSGASFVFVTKVASGATFGVTVLTQPTALSQNCVVTQGTGTITNADVSSVVLTCTTNAYPVAVTVTGLSGSGLVLQDNGGDDLSISGNGTFSFVTSVSSGAAFNVTVSTQPSSPSQTCAVAGASGTVGSAAISSVTVSCDPNQYTVSGTASGLAGAGLTLTLNGGTALAITSNGNFAFPMTLSDQTPYTVTVASQPLSPWQTCSLTGDTGTIAAANVSNVQLTCAPNTYAVGVTVTGLQGAGLVLQDNSADDLQVSANGTFAFATPVPSGQPYIVTVSQQPTSLWQTCTVVGGTGTVAGAPVDGVTVNCVSNTYSVGGTISGLAGSVVLQDNAGDTLLLTANGAFTFAAPVASGAPYSVAVSLQPASPSQTCTVTNDPAGTITGGPIGDVVVTCFTNPFSVGGTVVGLIGSGLVIHDNVGDSLPISSNGPFTFATSQLSGAAYSVAVTSQPSQPAQFCAASGGTGTVGGSNVVSITINCTLSFAVGGSVSGLSGSGLVLQDNLGDNLAISGLGSFAFATPLPSGSNYSVSVLAQPTAPWQTCTASAAAGVVSNANVTSVGVGCVTNPYTISVNVTGLSGSGFALVDNGSDALDVSDNGVFTFASTVLSGSTYSVAVQTPPSSPPQVCTISDSSGAVAGSDVTLTVACVLGTYTIGGTLSGLSGTGLVLQDNGGDDLPLAANGAFTFATPVTTTSAYSVSVLTQPSSPAQFCTVTSGAGTVGNSNVTDAVVTCALIQDFSLASCGASGASGPNQAQCTSAYAGTSLDAEVTVSGSGIQTWTAPATGTYIISASGAQGGTNQNTGGRGAVESGTFSLTAGTVLQILVGQAGAGSSSGNQCGGGGGASYVVSDGTPLIIAAGGGGADIGGGAQDRGQAAQGACTASGGGGGVAASSWGAGGGGFSGNGANDAPYATGGTAFTNGGQGGHAGSSPHGGSSAGGFGGGGGAGYFGSGGSGGGGGGYLGGNGDSGSSAGSGGISCNSGSSPSNSTGAAGGGNGSVTISLL